MVMSEMAHAMKQMTYVMSDIPSRILLDDTRDVRHSMRDPTG
jgi:hypothetical protein